MPLYTVIISPGLEKFTAALIELKSASPGSSSTVITNGIEVCSDGPVGIVLIPMSMIMIPRVVYFLRILFFPYSYFYLSFQGRCSSMILGCHGVCCR